MELFDKNELLVVGNCPICGGASKEIDQVKTIHPQAEFTLSLKECNVCGHWWHGEMLNQDYLSRLYAESSPFVVGEDRTGSMDLKIDMTKPVNSILKVAPQSKFNYLEIGSGTGALLKEMESHTDQAWGVEPGSWGRGNNQVVADVRQLPSDVKFDVVVINDALEHVVNPKKIIKDLEKNLNDGAVLLCCFPNKDCFKTKMRKGKWGMVRPWGHLHYFSTGSSAKMFGDSWKVFKQKKARPGDQTMGELIKYFFTAKNYKSFRQFIYLLINIFFGKDQWRLVARYRTKI